MHRAIRMASHGTSKIGLGAPANKRSLAQAVPFLMQANAADSSVADKYRAKLEQKAASEGVTSVDELKEKYKEKIEKVKTELGEDPITAATKAHENETAKAAQSAIANAPKVPSSDIKDLDSFVDVSKFKLHDRKEIEMLWKMRHAANPHAICGIIDGSVYAELYKNARKNPMFVLPLPRNAPREAEADTNDGGVEMHLVQWAFPGPYTVHCMITTLAEFKLHQEFARPHTTLIMHSDLLADKGIALMNGNVEKESSVNLEEAHLLTLFLQKFYAAKATTESGKRKLALLQAFTTGDANFSLDQLVAEAETLD
ncbi:hypothetical protein D0Z00_003279 [Geotrichum galactomycetum]|uniref:Uncharacterized protein n=1 Tax=Geotrichum galactomycetum TaxID=27317 RepID=A0ACB6V1Q0_9ASCO|nr:hypothetical protein D0Z00_003279 [Geotrichum candidum]